MSDLIEVGGFLPHGVCYLQQTNLILLHVVSDALVALAYFMIPLTLVYVSRRIGRRLSFNWAIGLFAAFIILCGAGHVLDIVVVWKPLYWLQGWQRALTAAVSLATAFAIIPLIPRLLSMRTPEELETANLRLREEIKLREGAEADLRRSLTEYKRAVQELEQFAYITSHDLQAPLRNVSGFSQLLMRRHRDKLGGDAVEFLDFIDKGVRQMQTLITDLLALSRVGRGDSSFTRAPLEATLKKTLVSLKPTLESRGASVQIDDSLPEIKADHGLLTQLFQNLIDNASKFHRPGVAPLIRVSAWPDGSHWHLVIKDNGIGVPADQLETIFAVFRRLHHADDYEGTGIGLAICRKIANHHGGEIWAESKVGEGTEFHIRLPREPATPISGGTPKLEVVL
ncbi:MAG: two-component sensor histidine kinase [Hydrocarboniphaga sp.]|uniref:sensor histidine kinase n=1 Tax=Hydrocarboniphaga sp. TaxID=2033016 RepID=UPI002616B6CB|nr:ATP-binding protein [Hydrocarboniphaga sp.]MDB5969010.1 two-component sensor histidine kinase [Hydrocarboniphaga sp.]